MIASITGSSEEGVSAAACESEAAGASAEASAEAVAAGVSAGLAACSPHAANANTEAISAAKVWRFMFKVSL